MAKKVEYLLVDGYNIIYAWDNLKKIADSSLEDARIKLLDILCDYAGYKQIKVIAVFDSHKVKKGAGSTEDYNNIKVVYTKEAETADNYIERTTYKLSKSYNITVATSDYLEQLIILGSGALRISASELRIEIDKTRNTMRKEYIDQKPVKRNMLMDNLDKKTLDILEEMRRRKE